MHLLYSWMLMVFIIGVIIVAVSMGGLIYRAFMDSFRDGMMLTLFALILAVGFIPFTIFGLGIVAYNSITGKEVS